MSNTSRVMPEELRRRLQQAQLNPLCWYLAGKVTVKLSLGSYYNPDDVRKFIARSPKQVITVAEKMLGKKLPKLTK